MPGDKRLAFLAWSHFTFGLLAGIFALIRLTIAARLVGILIVPLITSSSCQAFLLAVWGVTSRASLWKRIAGLVAGTVYLETVLVLAVDRTLFDLATITVTVTTIRLFSGCSLRSPPVPTGLGGSTLS
jgi:hypothetical protein